MSCQSQVMAAKSPREALLVLASEIDRINARLTVLESAGNEWDEWPDPEAPTQPWDDSSAHAETHAEFEARLEAQHRAAQEAMSNQGAREIVIPPASDEKMERRRMLERQQLKLAQATGDDSQDWNEIYAKGGPWWLYQGNRELVIGYDYSVRQALVTDVEEDDPKAAYEMGLDILKQPAGEPDLETGTGALAVSTLTSAKAAGRA